MQNQFHFSKFVSSSLIIAGTTIGAGMLGIPLRGYEAGFFPSTMTLFLGWLFMLASGYLFLEVSLRMHEGSNVLSMSQKYIGRKGKYFSGAMFLFLYYCLLVAYFAAGAPLLGGAISALFGGAISPFQAALIFGLLFWAIVTLGVVWIDRTNLLLISGVVISYLLLVGMGSGEIDISHFEKSNWGALMLPLPILFTAFGYHNVIPSLCAYCKRSRSTLLWSLFAGTMIPLIFYVTWNWLTIGTISPELFEETINAGLTAASALDIATGKPLIAKLANFFAFFAIVTSLLGIALSMVDFMGDGLAHRGIKAPRSLLSAMTFLPPFLFAVYFPKIFDTALGVAGGYGEAYLNGLLPVILVYSMRYKMREESLFTFPGGKLALLIIALISILVMAFETLHLFHT